MPIVPPRVASWVLSGLLLAGAAAAPRPALAADAPAVPVKAEKAPDAGDLLRGTIYHWMDLVEPGSKVEPKLLAGRYTLTKSDGLPKEAAGGTLRFHYLYPDKLRVTVTGGGETNSVGRDGQHLWAHRPALRFGVVGKPGVVRFKEDPSSVDNSVVPPFQLPYSKLKVRAMLLLVRADYVGKEQVGGADCHVLSLAPKGASLIGAEGITAKVWIRIADQAVVRVTATDGKGLDVRADADEVTIGAPPPAEGWALTPNAGDHIETVAVSHLTRMLEVGPKLMENDAPTLPAAKGKVRVVARSGAGRLEVHDGARVLFLKGTPEEMGRQHGELLRDEVRDVMERVLYGVGVGSSFAKGRWFFGEVEEAQARVGKFVDPRVLKEMDALAAAAGVHPQEARLANFFPELFHCSGFALTGKATKDGHVYHGRVLDYMRGVGLETQAVTVVYQPTDGRHAWANITYAGFVGSVTAMNAKGISVGEMGGRGAGDWD
ncbi:MAG TPA: C45 family autoproteolytic acyltransferase/hydrolase, partial [Humisphaera sp.]